TPSSSPVDELVVVVETLDSVPVLVLWVVVLDWLVVLDSEPVLVVSDVVDVVLDSLPVLVVSEVVVSVVVSVVVVDVVVGVVVVDVVVVSVSPQFSEFVLLGEITLPPSLTAKTPRMPPVVAVNADVTVIDQATTLPLVLFAPVRVIEVSFLDTLPIGSAFEPLFGARYTVMTDPTSRVFVSVNEPSMWPTLSPWQKILALPAAAARTPPTFAWEVVPSPVGSAPLLPGPLALTLAGASAAKTRRPAAK